MHISMIGVNGWILFMCFAMAIDGNRLFSSFDNYVLLSYFALKHEIGGKDVTRVA